MFPKTNNRPSPVTFGLQQKFYKKNFPNALYCAPMQENVQTSLHVDWAVWVKTDWARRGGRKRRQKKATKHHKCGTPIMHMLISYFGVGIIKFVGQHLDTQGLSAEPSMKNRINSNSTAWYWKVRVQEDTWWHMFIWCHLHFFWFPSDRYFDFIWH